MKHLIKLNRNEANVLIKKNLHKGLHKTNTSKKQTRKKYYVPEDNYKALKIVAEIRKCNISDLTSAMFFNF